MPTSEIKIIYDSLLESNYLLSMFPDLSGEWEKDKHYFSIMYQQNEDLLNATDFDFDDEY